MKRLLAILAALMCCLTGVHIQVYAEEESEIAAVSYVLMEMETGTVLLGSNAEQKVSCGTMAKLMTALLTAEMLASGEWQLETQVEATGAVEGIQGAVIWLMPGEKMTVEDLLKGLIIGNAGDAAIALAVGISGSVEEFVKEMNARAFDLDMRNTWFSSPQGDDSASQYTTAKDLALLCRALAEYEVLTPYFQTWRDFLRGEATELVNENTFARTDETSIGFKACHSSENGWSIAAGAQRQHMQCVAIVLGCETDEDRFALAKSLLRKGFAGWKVVQPGFSGEFLYPVHVKSGVENAVLAEPGKMRLLVVPRQSDELETVLVLPRYVDAPVKKGQKLGTAAFYEGDTLLYEMEVVAADDVRKQNYWDALQKITVKMLKL